MDPFFDKWVAAEGVHHAALTRDDPIRNIDTSTDSRVQADAGIECINCSVCYAACDTVTGNKDYCPNQLDPMSAIAGLKRETMKHFFKRRKSSGSNREKSDA